MAGSDEDEYGDFERGKAEAPVEEVKNTVKEDRGAASVRDKAKDLKQHAVEKIAPVLASAKEKLEKADGKRPAVQEEAKQMLDQAKHTVGRVVQQESRDVVEGMRRLAKDEKVFHEAAHKVAEKVTGGGATSSGKDTNENNEQPQQEGQQHHRHHNDFSDFSEMEEDGSDEEEGSNHPKKHLLDQHHQRPQHNPPEQKQKRKKSPLGYFKFGAKHGGKEKGKEDQKQDEQQQGVLGSIRDVFGDGSQGQNTYDIASGLAQKKLGQMRHVVDAEMDEAGNVTAAEKKTQGVGLVQSFVCLCTCASSVHVSG